MSQNKKIKKKNARKVKVFTFFKNMDPELKSILLKCVGTTASKHTQAKRP